MKDALQYFHPDGIVVAGFELGPGVGEELFVAGGGVEVDPYATLVKMDLRLLEAAKDLGATPWKAFWLVTVPLSKNGIVAGSMLVFIPSVGEYVIPELLGGPHLADAIQQGARQRHGGDFARFQLAQGLGQREIDHGISFRG